MIMVMFLLCFQFLMLLSPQKVFSLLTCLLCILALSISYTVNASPLRIGYGNVAALISVSSILSFLKASNLPV